jgi:hypothetical protein
VFVDGVVEFHLQLFKQAFKDIYIPKYICTLPISSIEIQSCVSKRDPLSELLSVVIHIVRPSYFPN